MMMSLDAVVGRPPLVLRVDPVVASRHWMWRTLSQTFGVLEAGDARGARSWLARRPDIDALIVKEELPDGRGGDLVRELADAKHRVAAHALVLARPSPEWASIEQSGATIVELGDLRGALSKLAAWFLDVRLSKALLREAERSAGS